jgi:hypothetical protein
LINDTHKKKREIGDETVEKKEKEKEKGRREKENEKGPFSVFVGVGDW